MVGCASVLANGLFQVLVNMLAPFAGTLSHLATREATCFTMFVSNNRALFHLW